MITNTPAAQDPVYSDAAIESVVNAIAGFIVAYVAIALIFSLIYAIAEWRLFSKAGCPGWAIFVPVYNTYCLFRLLFGKGWLFLLLLVPIVNFFVLLILPFRLGAVFSDGVGSAFGLGLGFLFMPALFILLVGFGPFDYSGPN